MLKNIRKEHVSMAFLLFLTLLCLCKKGYDEGFYILDRAVAKRAVRHEQSPTRDLAYYASRVVRDTQDLELKYQTIMNGPQNLIRERLNLLRYQIRDTLIAINRYYSNKQICSQIYHEYIVRLNNLTRLVDPQYN